MDGYLLYFFPAIIQTWIHLTFILMLPFPVSCTWMLFPKSFWNKSRRKKGWEVNHLVESSVDGTLHLQVCFHPAFPLLQLQRYDFIPSFDGELSHCVHFGTDRPLQRVLSKSFQSVEGILHKKNMLEFLSWISGTVQSQGLHHLRGFEASQIVFLGG